MSHRERAEIFDEKVLSQIERILNPDDMEKALKHALKQAKAAHKSNPNLGEQLDAEIKKLERERDNTAGVSHRWSWTRSSAWRA